LHEARQPIMPRRSFLRTVAGGSAAIAAASMLPAGCARSYPQADGDGAVLRSLSAKEYAVARAAAAAMLVGVPVSAQAVARAMDDALATMGEPVRGDMKTVLKLLEHLTILEGRVQPFTALAPEARRAVLHGWSRSRFALRRGAYQAVHGFVFFFAYAQDETRAITGFEGPWPERFDLPVPAVDFGEVR
jgi:hypothetical protein